MRKAEEELIEAEVIKLIMPDIKAFIPTILGWILRTIFPKLQAKIIERIKAIVEMILLNRKHEGN